VRQATSKVRVRFFSHVRFPLQLDCASRKNLIHFYFNVRQKTKSGNFSLPML
jgi:hypothetical protein